MFDGIVKTRREICMSTLGGCNTLIYPTNGDEIKIRTGCKNMPAKSSKFCSNCRKLVINHHSKLSASDKVGPNHVLSMVKEFPQDLAFIEEIHNNFRNERKEVLVKLLGDPFKKYVKIKTLSRELQSIVRGIDVAKLQPFKDVICMEVDKIDSFYAFDPSCSIVCNTEKYSLSKHNKSYIKRTRSAGWMGMFRPCNTRFCMYEMYRSESRLQVWAFLV